MGRVRSSIQLRAVRSPEMSILFDLLLFPPPPSIFLTAMSAVSFASLAYTGVSEIRGKHLRYSKFWNAASPAGPGKAIKLSSRAGMLLLYTPALLAAAVSFAVPAAADGGARLRLLSLSLGLHFFKRVFEVLFIHRYSGHMILDSAIPISFSYFISTVSAIYAQYFTKGMPEPALDLKYTGVVLFLIGIIGNFYHHYLLSTLRGEGDKGYKIPRGGLFGLVICPHYLFEIVGFVGVSFIAQTVYALSFTLGTICYLMGRSYVTRKWYLSKFDGFPVGVKALIPYIF